VGRRDTTRRGMAGWWLVWRGSPRCESPFDQVSTALGTSPGESGMAHLLIQSITGFRRACSGKEHLNERTTICQAMPQCVSELAQLI